MPQNIVIKYSVDTADLNKARRELGLTESKVEDIIEQWVKMGGVSTKVTHDMEAGANKTGDALNKANKSGGLLNNTLKDIGKGLAAYFTLDAMANFARQVVAVTGEFQKLEAQLTTALGSKGAAKQALANIQDFAAKTPSSVREITEVFVKMANRGLVPTNEQLTKMGDLASALGKPMAEVNEALLDVSNTERWNELGIKVKSNGDKMSGTFKGLTVEVARTEAGALQMIERFGQMQGVAGGMELQMNTLNGKLSNAGDAMDSLFNTIGSANEGVLKSSIEMFTGLIQSIESLMITSDQLAERMAMKDLGAFTDQVKDKYTEVAVAARKSRQDVSEALQNEAIVMQFYVRDQLNIARKEFDEFDKTILLRKRKLNGDLSEEGNAPLLPATKKRYEELLALVKLWEGKLSAIKTLQQEVIQETADVKPDAEPGRIQELTKLLADEQKLREGLHGATLKADLTASQLRSEGHQKELDALNNLLKTQREREREALMKRLEPDTKATPDASPVPGLDVLTASKSEQYDQALKMLSAFLSKRKIALDEGYASDLLLKGQYDYETDQNELLSLELRLDLAKKYGQDTIALEEQIAAKKADIHSKELSERENREKEALAREKELKEMGVKLAVDLSKSWLLSEFDNGQQRVDALTEQYNREVALVGDNDKAKARLKKDYDAKLAAERTKQAKAERDKALYSIAIDTAVAVIKAIAASPTTFGLPFSKYALIEGGLLAGAVLAKPLPKFRDGTRYVQGAGTGTSDSIHAMLSKGEGVVPAHTNALYDPALNAIQEHRIPADVLNRFVVDYGKFGRHVIPMRKEISQPTDERLLSEMKEIKKAIKSQAHYHTTVDQDGVKHYVQRGNSRTELLNTQKP